MRDNEARLMGLINTAMDAIITIDENQNVVASNDSVPFPRGGGGAAYAVVYPALTPGNYQVQLTRDGFYDSRVPCVVKKGEVCRVDATLRRK